MKIAYLSNVRYPSERAHTLQITEMCRAFSKHNWEVTLFVNNRGTGDSQAAAVYFKTDISFALQRLPEGLLIPGRDITYLISEYIFATAFLLTKNRKKYDVYYSRHEWIVNFLSGFIPIERLVYESHEAKWNYPARRLLKKGIKTVVISDGIRDFYIEKGIPTGQLHVAYDAIDEMFFDKVEPKTVARQRLGLPQDKKIAMYIGGFDGWKGVETFFAAAALAPEVLFVAIGGSKENVLRYQVLYPEVRFLGQQPYAALRDNQQAADILVIPNTAKTKISALYTSPLKLFAHLTSGVPLVVSDVASLTSVTGRSDVTVSVPDSAEDLANKISLVASDYAPALKQAEELKIRSVRYTWTNRAMDIINFLNYA